MSTLEAVDHEVSNSEDMINDLKQYLTEQQKLSENAEALKGILERFQQRNEHIASNLPQHLPGREPR